MQAKRDVLTRDLAEKRAARISGVSYKLHVSLRKGDKGYKGNCKISFSYEKPRSKEKLIIDFIGSILKVLANGKEIKFEATSSSIEIAQEDLFEGKNIIEINYENDYDLTGDGFHHFKDPEDGEEYLFTHLEPYNAHRFWPCFDQPDLKANFKLTVDSPRDWTIISNTLEESVSSGNESKTTIFKETPRISTYLFHLSAGGYKEYKDEYKSKSRKIPLKIFCRKSLAKHFEKNVKDEMFKVTKQGLAFYSEFFDFPYPFEKYDQLFVPEFNMGAMENVGAVTFVERLVFRHKPTRTELSTLADIVLHEMVHMWFGNLVTMRWWDDLWLNESFADFLSYYGLFKATEYKEAWQLFYMRKSWAYVEDQMITTHPIAADAEDTDIAFSNFDGISYAKGASVLKQLVFYIGTKNFRDGLRHYFKDHQWKNTELKDFLHSMEKASGKSLKNWAKSWLSTTGVNAARPKITIKDGKITELAIEQIKNHSPLKEHKTKVALLYEKDGKCEVGKEMEVLYSKEKTRIHEAEGIKAPQMAFINYQDKDYSKTLLGQHSLKYATKNISKIKDPLTRQMVLGAIWQMIRDAETDPRAYLKIVKENALIEHDIRILENHFGRAAKIIVSYLGDEEYYKYSEEFYDLALEGLKKSSKENKNAWFGLLVATANGARSVKELIGLLDESIEIKDFSLNQEHRWAIITTLESRGHELAGKMLEKEEKRDPSDRGKKSAFEARVSRLKDKQRHWDMFVEAKTHSLDYLREGMDGFYKRRQKERLSKYSNLFFKVIKNIFATKDRHYAVIFFNNLFPSMYVQKETLSQIESLLKDKNLQPLLRKELLKAQDEMKRTIKILRKFNGK